VTSIGMADELLQMRLPGRQAGIDDLIADVLGAAVVLWILSRLARRAPPA